MNKFGNAMTLGLARLTDKEQEFYAVTFPEIGEE